MKDDTLGFYNTTDLREAARRRLPHGLFEFMDRGNDDDIAMRDNRIALESIKLKPRVLVDVSKRSQEISLFGKTRGGCARNTVHACSGLDDGDGESRDRGWRHLVVPVLYVAGPLPFAPDGDARPGCRL